MTVFRVNIKRDRVGVVNGTDIKYIMGPLKAQFWAWDTRLEAAARSKPAIKWGEKGKHISKLQQALNMTIAEISKGRFTPLADDGDFGNKTYYAVKQVQKELPNHWFQCHYQAAMALQDEDDNFWDIFDQISSSANLTRMVVDGIPGKDTLTRMDNMLVMFETQQQMGDAFSNAYARKYLEFKYDPVLGY